VEIDGNGDARISGGFERDIPELLATEGSYNIIPDRPPPAAVQGSRNS
jgi:hypothetical protein